MPARTDPKAAQPQRATRCWLALISTGLLSVSLQAQTQVAPSWPNATDMERARQAHPMPTPAQLDRQASVPSSLPFAPELRATTPVPRVKLPETADKAASALDLVDLARQGHALGMQGAAAQRPTRPLGLRIFVTLDMPAASLRKLIEQGERAGATLILRGLKDRSMRQTLARVNALLGQHRTTWQIDPDAFERYRVQNAPTFVLDLPDAPGGGQQDDSGRPGQCHGEVCSARGAYAKVSGDVSLDYALETISRQVPLAAPRAREVLERLR